MTQDIQVGGNGHKPTYAPNAYAPGSVLRPGEGGNADKIILEIGKEERGLLMKADFINDEHVKKAVLAIQEAREFHLTTLENMIWDTIAGFVSINGKRTNQYVTLRTGVWQMENKLKNAFTKDQKESEEARK